MKANEAPKKIYFTQTENGMHYYTEGIPSERNYIEYTRTDAFIEKVGSFLNKKDDRDSYTIGYIKRHLEEIIKEIGL